ncbi:type I secretion C-terminal target domain-containing protein, partial [Acinetobacter junii]|uniref:type I secretion C-terminal target domain-containing protein n=1 Tax=Acinetobacter junii TaxID=40215 RepID=UPI003A872540
LELTGSANINAIGNSLNNILIGNSGNNILNGSLGADSLKGGLGNDTAIYSLLVAGDALGGNGSDRWQDFNVGSSLNVNSDRIDISDLLIGDIDASLVQDFISVINNGTNTVIYLDRDGVNTSYNDTLLLTLEGVSTSLNELMTNQQIII